MDPAYDERRLNREVYCARANSHRWLTSSRFDVASEYAQRDPRSGTRRCTKRKAPQSPRGEDSPPSYLAVVILPSTQRLQHVRGRVLLGSSTSSPALLVNRRAMRAAPEGM